MSCRSEVRFATTSEGYALMRSKVDEMSEGPDARRLLGAAASPEFFREDGGCVAFGWSHIKWHGDCPEVRNITRAFEAIALDGVPCEFCRVGESWDDIEFECHNDNDLLALHVEPVTAIDVFRSWPPAEPPRPRACRGLPKSSQD